MLGSQARSAEQPPNRGAATEMTQVEHELCWCLAKLSCGCARCVQTGTLAMPLRWSSDADDESDYSASPPPSDQSSDWHSSDEDDKPRRKPMKKKKKLPARAQHQLPQQPQRAQPRQAPMQHSSQQMQRPGGMYARGGIFGDEAPFGGAFSGVDPLRMPGGGANPAMARDALQVRYSLLSPCLLPACMLAVHGQDPDGRTLFSLQTTPGQK